MLVDDSRTHALLSETARSIDQSNTRRRGRLGAVSMRASCRQAQCWSKGHSAQLARRWCVCVCVVRVDVWMCGCVSLVDDGVCRWRRG